MPILTITKGGAMRYIILVLLPLLIFSQEGLWFYPTNTESYVQDESTAMTFGIGDEGDPGCLYVLFREEATLFRAYDQANNQWYTQMPLDDVPEWGSAICAWHNHGSIPPEYKVFAIPYDIQRGGNQNTGHIYEYDIPTNTWTTLDTVPHDNITHGHGLSLKTGNNDGTYINLYYFGGDVPGVDYNDGFWVYRRLLKPAGPGRGPNPVKNHWDRLADLPHGEWSRSCFLAKC